MIFLLFTLSKLFCFIQHGQVNDERQRKTVRGSVGKLASVPPGRVCGDRPTLWPAGHAAAGIGLCHRLLSPLERKTSWQLSEAMGRQTPYSLQHLLDRARWDADAVRDDVRGIWLSIWANPRRCWWSMKPALSRNAAIRSGCSGAA
jgi:hypothetical protein